MCEHEVSGSGKIRRIRDIKKPRKPVRFADSVLLGICVFMLAVLVALLPVRSRQLMPDLIQDVRDQVVHVMKVGQCQGSGVALTKDIVMTARHVTYGDASSAYIVTLDDGNEVPVLKVVEDKENDIAYLLVKDAVLKPAVLAPKNPLAGEMVIVFGSPLGFENFNTASPGWVTALGRDLYSQLKGREEQKYEWHQMIQSNAPSYPGNSGGPVFNMKGEVCGILVAGRDACLNWSVPVERFRDSLNRVQQWIKLSRFEVLEEKEEPPVQQYNGYRRPRRPGYPQPRNL